MLIRFVHNVEATSTMFERNESKLFNRCFYQSIIDCEGFLKNVLNLSFNIIIIFKLKLLNFTKRVPSITYMGESFQDFEADFP